MEVREICKELKDLCQLDIDAIHAYNAAIEHIDINEVKKQLISFREDHERHVRELSDMIRSYKEEPPAFSKDFKGYMLEAFTRMRGVTGNEGALKALKGGEESVTKKYRKAAGINFPMQVKSLVESNYTDEQRHLAYVTQAVEDKVWEKTHV